MRKALILCALLFAAGAAHADNMLYFGGGLTNGTVHDVLNSGLNVDNSEYKFYLGTRPPGSPFGAEIEYLSFGSATSATAHGSGDAISIIGLGYLPVVPHLLDVYGKAGFSRTQLNGNALRTTGPTTTINDSQVRFTFGVGAQAHIFGNLAARLEYQHYSIVGTNGANILMLGVQVSLL